MGSLRNDDADADRFWRPFTDNNGQLVVGMRSSGPKYIFQDEMHCFRASLVARASDGKSFLAKVIKFNGKDASAYVRCAQSATCCCLADECNYFNCARIVSSHYSAHGTGDILIILDYCDAGNLGYQLSLLRNPTQRGGFRERDAKLIILQIALALHRMHTRNISNLGISDRNVLLSTSGMVKLGDLNFERSCATCPTNYGKNAAYLAPEVWKGRRCGCEADMWSLGILAYECVFGVKPFVDDRLADQILHHEVRYPEGHTISPEYIGLIDSMLKKNPSDRITSREFLAHPLMRSTLSAFESAVSVSRRLTATDRALVLECIAEVDTVRMSPEPPSDIM